MRRLVLALVVAAGLTLAPAAGAKGELIAVEVCGSSGCNRAEDEETLRSVPTGGEAEEPLGSPAPFFRVTFVIAAGTNTDEWTIYYLPSRNALAFLDPYDSVQAAPIFGAEATGVMRKLASGLTPFRRPWVTSVSVGEHVLRGPAAAAYLQLFEAGTRVPLEYADEWVPIDLRSASPTPWTEGAREFLYSPDEDLIERGGVTFELPEWLAGDLEAARPLAAGGAAPRPPWHWGVAGIVVLVAVPLGSRLRKKSHRSPV